MWTTTPFRRAAPALVDTRPDEPTVTGRSTVAPYGVGSAYSVARSMAAYSAFPLVYAAVSKRAEDLAALPLVIQRAGGRRDSTDPVLRLFARPTPRGSGVSLRQQMIVDLCLHGTSYLRIVGEGASTSLVRLHPGECQIEAWLDGQPGSVLWQPSGTGPIRRLTPGQDVLVVSLPSWREGAQSVYGTGAIEVLHETLAVERAAFARARQSLEAGKPSMIARPPAPSGPGQLAAFDGMTDTQRTQLEEQLRGLFSSGSGGVVVLGRALDLTTPQWSMHDLQALQVGQVAAERILAACKVPPAKLGLPWANQAPARDQDRVYWESLAAVAQLVDDVWSNWLDSLPGYAGARIHHDLRGVRAAQFAQDGAVARVVQLVSVGVPLRAALRSQGIEIDDEDLDAAPARPVAGEAGRPMDGEPPADTARPQGPQRSEDPMDAPDYSALARLLAGKGE